MTREKDPRNRPMRVVDLLAASAQYLNERGVQSARLDAELLLAHVLKVDRLGLYMVHDRPVVGPERDAFRGLIKRRLDGEPVAYILGRKEFYGLEFDVDSNVLVPRPETEILVDRTIEVVKAGNIARPRIAEVGVGSGAISVALAINIEQPKIVATDISPQALKTAERNAEKHSVKQSIMLVQTDVLNGVKGPFDIVVGNPPYISEAEEHTLPIDIRNHEPRIALIAGSTGLEIIEKLVPQAVELLVSNGVLIFEIGIGQSESATELLTRTGAFGSIESANDLAGHPRVVIARKENK